MQRKCPPGDRALRRVGGSTVIGATTKLRDLAIVIVQHKPIGIDPAYGRHIRPSDVFRRHFGVQGIKLCNGKREDIIFKAPGATLAPGAMLSVRIKDDSSVSSA